MEGSHIRLPNGLPIALTASELAKACNISVDSARKSQVCVREELGLAAHKDVPTAEWLARIVHHDSTEQDIVTAMLSALDGHKSYYDLNKVNQLFEGKRNARTMYFFPRMYFPGVGVSTTPESSMRRFLEKPFGSVPGLVDRALAGKVTFVAARTAARHLGVQAGEVADVVVARRIPHIELEYRHRPKGVVASSALFVYVK